MLRDETTSKLVGLPQDLARLAEVLVELLTPKLNETFMTAFEVESTKVRTDLLCALKELRKDLRLEEFEGVVGNKGVSSRPKMCSKIPSPPRAMIHGNRSSSASNLDVDVSPAITSRTSDSLYSQSLSPMPAQRAKPRLRSHLLERQLAEEVIAAKLLNKTGNSGRQGSHSMPLWRRQTTENSEVQGPHPMPLWRRQTTGNSDRQGSHSASPWRRQTTGDSEGQGSHVPNPTRQISFRQVVPADSETAMTNTNSKETSRSLVNMGTGMLFTSSIMTPPVEDPSGCDGSPATSLRDTCKGPSDSSQLSRVPTEDSEEVPNPYGSTSTSMNWRSTVSLRFRRLGSAGSSSNMDRWKNEARKFYDHRQHSLDGGSWGLARRIYSIMPRALALHPWDANFVWLSKIYQFLFSVALLLSTVSVVTRIPTHGSEADANNFTIHIDTILAIGSLLGFLASTLKNKAYVESHLLVESYLSRADILEELNLKSCMENGAILLVWVCCVVSRLYAHAFEVHLYEIGFAFNVLTLLGICADASRLCHGLHFIVDSYCQYIIEKPFDFEDAMQEWFLLHCTIRTACASLQMRFVALQLTAIGTFLFGAASIYLRNGALEHVGVAMCIPGALCFIVFLQLSMRAGLVSDLCRRVPMLVSSSKAEFELKRMYLVEYIVHCETGFYIFEVRLTSAMLLKMFYIASAATLGLLTQVLRRIS